jgi:hypothetical protein
VGEGGLRRHEREGAAVRRADALRDVRLDAVLLSASDDGSRGCGVKRGRKAALREALRSIERMSLLPVGCEQVADGHPYKEGAQQVNEAARIFLETWVVPAIRQALGEDVA